MERKWTPGPWRSGQDGNDRVYGADAMGAPSGLIAVVYKGRANARLVAAAPELYEALDAALADADGTVDGETGMVLSWVEDARAALAKARGETP